MMIRILITGAGGSAAANFYDALKLSHDHYYTVGCDISPYHLELIDVDERYVVPPVSDPEYMEAMQRVIALEHPDFLHPQPDVEVAYWAEHRHEIPVKTFLPSTQSVAICHDKMWFNQILKDKNVVRPRAHRITSAEDLRTALADLLSHDSRAWIRAVRGAGSRASLPVGSFAQADAWVDYWHSFRGLGYQDFMVSEFLPGREFAWQSLWYRGALITAQSRERLEYFGGNLTPSGQSSSPSVARTINRDDINSAGMAAVLAVDKEPHGVFCVDMKENRFAVPMVTEINPGRFFTTSNFFAHAGLNMPAMYLSLGIHGSLSETPPQLDPLPEGLYWVRMMDMGYKLVENDTWLAKRV